MKDVLQTVIASLDERSGNGALFLREVKSELRTVRTAKGFAISMQTIAPKRPQRLALLTFLFSREITSTYDLKFTEIKAFNALMSVARAEFTDYLKETLTNECV